MKAGNCAPRPPPSSIAWFSPCTLLASGPHAGHPLARGAAEAPGSREGRGGREPRPMFTGNDGHAPPPPCPMPLAPAVQPALGSAAAAAVACAMPAGLCRAAAASTGLTTKAPIALPSSPASTSSAAKTSVCCRVSSTDDARPPFAREEACAAVFGLASTSVPSGLMARCRLFWNQT